MIFSRTVFIVFAYFITTLTIVSQRHHLLITLLALERIILILVIFIPLTSTSSHIPIVFQRIILLTFGACEARLGLSLIVLMSRSHGSDILNTISINKC